MPSFEKPISCDQDGNHSQCLLDVIVTRCDSEEPITQDLVFPALIDTGATNTCISTEIVKKLNLTSNEIIPINSASHKSVQVKLFQVHLHIPIAGAIKVINNQQRQEVALFTNSNVNVTELQHHDSNYHILLGMDVLVKCNFFMAHGKFVLSY